MAARFAEAEAAGAAGLWVVDHLFWGTPMLECLCSLAVATTATSRALLGSCVLQLPLRRPAALAKQVATLQLLSGGRLVLGVGVGSHPGEYRAAGADFATRGRDLDQGLDRLRACWAPAVAGEEAGSGEGDGNGVDCYRQAPVPVPVPVWVGGSSPAAIDRAARRGDGWVPLFIAPEDYRAGLRRIRRAAGRAGRDARRLAAAVVVPVSLGATVERAAENGTRWLGALYRLPPRAFARHLVAGTARQCADRLRRYRAAGAEHLVAMVADDRSIDQFAELAAALSDDTDAPAAALPPDGTIATPGSTATAGHRSDHPSPSPIAPQRPQTLEVPA
jgi:alkanesulfonate monooxygenase SsuD/methylene tetrahydromethanopterin reductase-like flavin-dependent oxidoreductase (luciferase family)